MNILGICHDVLICSACVMVDGKVIAAIPEERLDRVKQSRVFPRRAIDHCLARAGLTMRDIDEIAVGWNPGVELETMPAAYQQRRWRTEHWMQVPGRFIQRAGEPASLQTTISELYDGCPPITFVSHYWAHVGNGFLQSPFDSAAIVILDGRGEKHTVLHATGNGTRVETLSEQFFPHSLGLFYSTITQYLGYKPDSDEWKVMALASYADGKNPYYAKLRSMVKLDDNGRLRLDLSYFEFYNYWNPHMYSELLVDTLGAPRAPDDEYTDRHREIAAALQCVFEDVVTEMLTIVHKRTGLENLAASGGCFMNSVYNGKITTVTPFKRCHITFSPDDSGTSLGAAAWLYSSRTGKRPAPLDSPYLGGEYPQQQIDRVVTEYKLPNAERCADPAERAARDIADGRIIGWFQGRSEFGQRALGNRSILADPRRAEMKERINAAVKFREGYRPFAPAILSERAADYFDCAPDARVPYMERVFMFRQNMQESVPAVVHVDGSGRLQTVEQQANPRFHRLIDAFRALTGVPIVLNTSFNLNGEPVVETPEDAIRTFYSCGLDVLYLGDTRIAKQ
jgi:carbamoyltransferase